MIKIENYVQRIATPDWSIPKSVIKFHDLTFIYKGEAVYVIDDKPHKVSAGTILYIQPGCTRSAYTFVDNPMHSFALNLNTDNTSLLQLPNIRNVGLDEQLIELYLQFDKVWLSQDNYLKIKTNALIMLILCRINELHTSVSLIDKRIERAKEFILSNYQKDISVKLLSRSAGLNEIYFGALFKKSTGQSVNQYITSIRINKAKDLLADGNSVADTSVMCGFDNIFYFSNVFKKNVGKSPINFKK